jgi:DNA-binding MarR family transcriptional regulator
MMPTQLRVLVALGRDGASPWVDRTAIAAAIGLDDRNLKRALTALEQRGYVLRQRRVAPDGSSLATLFAATWIVGGDV